MEMRKVNGGERRRSRRMRRTANHDGQRSDKLKAIVATISTMRSFPTITAIVEAGAGAFSRSSVNRNLDLVDAAQFAFNERRRVEGMPTVPMRMDSGRTPRQDLEHEALKARCIDLETMVDERDATIERLKSNIDGLLAVVEAYRKGEADRRERRSPLLDGGRPPEPASLPAG